MLMRALLLRDRGTNSLLFSDYELPIEPDHTASMSIPRLVIYPHTLSVSPTARSTSNLDLITRNVLTKSSVLL